jgi:uncharacterized Zn-binding protein involved in type VI secretion
MNRKAVLVGDPLSSGGQVLPGTLTQITVKGTPLATIGSEAECAACQSVGLIAKAGGPYRPTMHGHEMALENDIVLCKCPVPPRLIASAIASSLTDVWVDDRVESMGPVLPPGSEDARFLRDLDSEGSWSLHASLRYRNEQSSSANPGKGA